MENLTIEKIREIIADKSVKFISSRDHRKKIVHFIFSTFTGSGKSTTVMQAIDKAGYTWMYFSPFHDVIVENLEYSKLRNYDYNHMKGKAQEGVCLAEDYKKYLKMGISITPFCEARCHLKNNGCPYYETKKRIESFPDNWAGVHAHIPTYLQKFMFDVEYKKNKMFKYYDVIILDEFPMQVLYNQNKLNRKDIDELRNVINKTPDSDEKHFIMGFLNEITLASGDIPINHDRLKSLLLNRSLDLKEYSKEYDITLLNLISEKKIKVPPKNILFNLRMLYEENPSIERLRWILYKHENDGWMKSGIFLTTSNIKFFKNIPIPIIALDATADIGAWNTLLNSNCRWENIDIEYKNIYQLRSHARYPQSSWIRFETMEEVFSRLGKKKVREILKLGRLSRKDLLEEMKKTNKFRRNKVINKTGEKLSHLIMKICERNSESVLICCTKTIRRLIETYLKDNYKKKNYEFANYYNLRSRNSFYENCDTCVIAHEPNIPPLTLEIMKNVVGWDINLLRELMTKSEIKQAIGRIRQNIYITPNGRIRKLIEVYLIPGAREEYEKFLPEVKLLSYDNMCTGKLITLEESIIKIVKTLKKTTAREIRELLDFKVSKEVINSYLKRIYLNGLTSDYSRNIEWIYDEEKARKTKYLRNSNGNV